jgi:hypothetical protein
MVVSPREYLKSTLAALSCVLLAACSPVVYDLPPIYAPAPDKALVGAKIGANEEKLVGPVEISTVRQAFASAPGPYTLCIRGSTKDPGIRSYAVFFKNDAYVTTRISLIADNCDTEVFTPLGAAPFAVAKPKDAAEWKPYSPELAPPAR